MSDDPMDACISHSRLVPTILGRLVRFEDYNQHRNRLGWRPTMKGAERLSNRWHEEAWSAWMSNVSNHQNRR